MPSDAVFRLRANRATLAAALLLGAGTAGADLSRAENFVLLDHQGKAHELYYQRDAAAVVIVAHDNSCADAAASADAAEQLLQAHPDARVYLLNAVDDRPAMAAFAASNGLTVPMLHDSAGIITPSLAMTRSGEAVVLDTQSWAVTYQGPVAGAVIGEQPASASSAAATAGCELALPRSAEVPDYASDIAPILERNCVACHTEGGIGPWAMSEYRMIQGFGPDDAGGDPGEAYATLACRPGDRRVAAQCPDV